MGVLRIFEYIKTLILKNEGEMIMRKKNSKGIVKKTVAIICLLIILQSYFISLSYIVKAADTVFDDTEVQSDDVVTIENNFAEEEANEVNSDVDNELLEDNKEDEINKDDTINFSQDDILNKEEKSEDIIDEPDESIDVLEESNENIEKEVIDENVEPQVVVDVISENSSIYKGYLYANATSSLKYETAYNTIDEVNITGSKNITKITVQDEPDKIVLITNTKLGLLSDMYYKQTRISVEQFNQILGKDGIITLYDVNNNVIGTISKDTDVINKEYVFKYNQDYNTIKFEFSNIVKDGKIALKNDKAIKENTVYSRNQISLFSTINTITNTQMFVGEEVIDYSSEGNINLEETQSKMVIDIDNDSLSVENENEVAINITLKTDEEKFDLFENPTISLEFPKEVEEVEIKEINLLYKNGLSLENWNVLENESGNQVIDISLIGSQMDYTPGSVQEGTTLVIYANVDVDRLTAYTSDDLKMTYTNKDTIRQSYALDGKEYEDISLSFVGTKELLRVTKAIIDDSIETTYNDDTCSINIDAESETEQVVTLTGTILNNFENATENVSIVGRIPFIGNKDGQGNDLGSIFNTTLVNSMITSGVDADIYYSEKEDATRNDDSWTQDVSDLSKYKSYKIEVKDGELDESEKLTFEYQISIPANVGYNEKAYSNYTVYYSLDGQKFSADSSLGILTAEKEITLDDINEEDKKEVAELTIGTQVAQCGRVLSEGDEVFERQILRYTVVVSNTSSETISNIKIKGNAENCNVYDWEYITVENYYGYDEYTVRQMKEYNNEEKEYVQFEIETLNPGETKTFDYQVIVKKIDEININQIYGSILISADNINEQKIETIKNNVKNGEIEIKVKTKSTESIDGREFGSLGGIDLVISFRNISNNSLDNIEIDLNIPENLSFKEYMMIVSNEAITYNIETLGEKQVVRFRVPELASGKEEYVIFTVQSKGIEYTSEYDNAIITASSLVNNNLYFSNDYELNIYQAETKIDYAWKADCEKNVVDNGDIIVYELTMNNIGLVNSNEIKISGNIPRGLNVNSLKLINENKEEEIPIGYLGDFVVSTGVNSKGNSKLQFVTEVNNSNFYTDQESIDFKLNVKYGYTEEFSTDVISYKINNSNVTENVEYTPIIDDSDDSTGDNIIDDSENGSKNEVNNVDEINISTNTNINNVKYTYNISGQVWIDQNKDGIKNDSKNVNGIEVILYGTSLQGSIDISNKISEVVTDENGQYSFVGVDEGNYVILFKYDSEIYSITKYQVNNATLAENSDAISKKVNIDNELVTVALTDVLTVNGSSLINIDLGLVTKNEFDLSLDKYIEKVTVINEEENKTYNYNNNDVKLEISSKQYKKSTLEITYKIVIKNEGDIAGYVNKIVDHIPDGMIINLESNKDWYYGDDGNLYYNALIGDELLPGDSREITLVLRKSLANGEAIKIINSAEIIEYTNAVGLEDKDSIKNNKNEKEDDFGKAFLTVSVSTGMWKYNILIILIVIFLIFVIYKVVRKVTTKKVYK